MSAGRALWFQARGNAVLRDEPLPELGPRSSLVRASYSAVSPGTEQLVFSGRVPPPMHDTMRVPYMAGDFGFPVKYGYSLVGRVESSDDAALRGRLVHLMHPHQALLVARNADLFPVPDAIPAMRATLASNLETAVNAVWDSGAATGNRCLVAGFGIIGSLIARLLTRMPEVAVVVADPEATKIDLASRFGFAAMAPERVAGPFDVAFHASATSEGLQLCIDRTGFEGTIVEASWYGDRPVTVQLGGSFHSERKRIVSTQVSTVAAPMRSRWSLARRKAFVFELLRDPAFDAHITEVIAFDGLAAYCNGGGLARPGLARVIEYRSGEAPCST